MDRIMYEVECEPSAEYLKNHISYEIDTVCVTYDHEEARAAAESEWAHLTARGQRNSRVVIKHHMVTVHDDEVELSAKELYDKIVDEWDEERDAQVLDAVDIEIKAIGVQRKAYVGHEVGEEAIEEAVLAWCNMTPEIDTDDAIDHVMTRLHDAVEEHDSRLSWAPESDTLWWEDVGYGRPAPVFDPAWWDQAVGDALRSIG